MNWCNFLISMQILQKKQQKNISKETKQAPYLIIFHFSIQILGFHFK